VKEQPALTPAGEQAWLRLKQHLSWCDHFALVFIFSRQPEVITLFRERLADIYRARVTRLEVPMPENSAELARIMLPRLLAPSRHEQALKAPCWLDLTRFGPDSRKDRFHFLVRLNEQREKLRNHNNRPLILILPDNERRLVRELTPDLWAIRDFSLETANWLQDQAQATPLPVREEHSPFPLSDYESSLIAEWERVRESGKRDTLLAGNRAWSVLVKSGRIGEAVKVAKAMTATSRQIIQRNGEIPESLRDLSVSLNKVGDTSARLGDLEEARRAYEESLSISRQIIERNGETPESLRDLSVSLDNVGDTSARLGDPEEARRAYEESLSISRQIIQRVGETPESLRDLAAALHKSGRAAARMGLQEQARQFFQEGLAIAETLQQALPDQVDYAELAHYFIGELEGLAS
jgi:tetratricopeptide (TPR) repeat protein